MTGGRCTSHLPCSGQAVTEELLSLQHVRDRPGDAAAPCQSVRYPRYRGSSRCLMHGVAPGQGPPFSPPLRACHALLSSACRFRRAPVHRAPRPSAVTLFHWSPAMDLPSTSGQSAPCSSPRTIAVVGLGTMGSGIAEVLARAGREVIGIDVSEAAARRATASSPPPRPVPSPGTGSPRRSARGSWPASGPSPTSPPRPRPTSSSRWSRRTTTSSTACSTSSTRSSAPTRSWPPAPTPCR